MSLQKECEINKKIAEEFCREHQEQTGKQLVFLKCGDPFPDALLKDGAGNVIGVEFVSVVLPWINQDADAFESYRKKFYGRFEKLRPRLENLSIGFQPSFERTARVVRADGPFLPKISSREGRLLVEEFDKLVSKHTDRFVVMGSFFVSDFKVIRPEKEPAALEFPTLSKYFDAIIINGPIPPNDKRKPHPEDPIIINNVVVYHGGEIAKSVIRAIEKKFEPGKGTAYSTDILLLHTLTDKSPAIAMHGEEIAELGKKLLEYLNERDGDRFGEVWFLNKYKTRTAKLFRIY